MTKSPLQPHAIQATFTDMFRQSVAVLSRPSPSTFEHFERRGGTTQAFVYVILAALVSAVVAAAFAPLHGASVTGQFLTRLVSVPLEFLVFTGTVFLAGRNLFRGTGTYPEVAYSFALFFVPLSILGSLIGILPFFGWVAGWILTMIKAYFGFMAVQSSMNLRDQGNAAITLIAAAVAQFAIGSLVAKLVLNLLGVTR